MENTEEKVDVKKTYRLKPMNYALLSSHGLNEIVNVFISTFLISYIYSISTNYMVSIGLFYLCEYLVMGIFYYIISAILDKTNRIIIYQIAIVIKCGFILTVVFMGQQLASMVVLAGALHGISQAMYWASYNVMKNELVSKHLVVRYSLFQQIMGKVVGIIAPIVLGKIIDAESFKTSAIIILVITVLELACSIVIKSKKPENSSFNMKGFISHIKGLGDRKPLVTQCLVMGMLSGVLTVLTPISTIITIYTFGSNFSLGMLTSVFAIASLIFLICLKRFTKFGKRGILYIICGTLPLVVCLLFVTNVNKVTTIIYSCVYNVTAMLYSYAYDISRNAVLKRLDMYGDIAEYQAAIECLMEAARTVVFAVMVVAGLIGASFGVAGILTSLKIIMVLAVCALFVMNMMLRNNEKKLVKYNMLEN